MKENNGSGRRANYITHTYCMHRVHNEDGISMNVEKGSCYLCGLNCTHTCGMIHTSSATIRLYIVANASHCFPWRYRNGNRDIGTTYATACFLHYIYIICHLYIPLHCEKVISYTCVCDSHCITLYIFPGDF